MFPREMIIFENGREVQIEVDDSEEATKISRYHLALRSYLHSKGEKKQEALQRLKKIGFEGVMDMDGVLHIMETNSEVIQEIIERREIPSSGAVPGGVEVSSTSFSENLVLIVAHGVGVWKDNLIRGTYDISKREAQNIDCWVVGLAVRTALETQANQSCEVCGKTESLNPYPIAGPEFAMLCPQTQSSSAPFVQVSCHCGGG